MEVIKKQILQILTTGSTTGGTVITPDLSVVYHMKIGLESVVQDIGFFDAYIAPPLTTLTVATLGVESVTDEDAIGSGTVLADGGKSVTERGLVWSINPNPTVADNKITAGSGLGKFTGSLTNLTPETIYYMNAYAINSDGLVYGQPISFTTQKTLTIITSPVTPLTMTTAIGGGEILTDGGSPIYQRGVVWSITANPTTADKKTINGWGTGTFVSSITGLTTLTTYHVRAYAINAEGTMYGNDVTFTSIGLPSITTNVITNITQTSATGGGNVLSEGGTSVTEKGIVYSLSSNPTLDDNVIPDGSGIGSFTSSLTGLIGLARYYVRAYAINIVGISYGNEVNFLTLVAPTVVTSPVTDITQTTAKSGGNITNDGGGSITAKGVEFGNVSGALTRSTNDGTGNSSFVSYMSGLVANSTFYVRAYATNAAGTGYGTELSYTTLPVPPPTITAYEMGPTTQTTSVIRANIVNTGSHVVTTRGVAYSTSPDPTITNYFAPNGSGNGMFDTTIGTNSPATNVPLMPGYTYYVRAYLYTAEDGYLYSNPVQIAALPITIPTLTTKSISNISSYGADSGGINISDGGGYITVKGIKFGNTSNNYTGTINAAGNGSADFTVSLSGLYTNTTYYVRAFATNSAGTGYGNNEVSFTTSPAIPTVTTQAAAGVTSNSAVGSGYVTTDGSVVTARGFELGLTPAVLIHNLPAGSGTGAFTGTLSPLSPNTTYYYRAYATNSAGTGYGTTESFITNPVSPPTITIAYLDGTSTTTAFGRAGISYSGSHVITDKGVVWATFHGPDQSSYKQSYGTGTNYFDISLSGLMPNTTYYARAYLYTAEDGYIYSDEKSFATYAPTLPTVGTTSVFSITDVNASASSEVTSDGGAPITSRGFVWGTSQNPTLSNNVAYAGSGSGVFSTTLSPLAASTTYYIRSFAINSAGTTYGTQASFVTPAPSLMYYLLYVYPDGYSTPSTYYSDSQHVTGSHSISVYDIVSDGNQQYQVRYAGPSSAAVAGKTVQWIYWVSTP